MGDPGHLLREVARDRLRRNAFLRLRQHDAAMPARAFFAIVAALVGLRLYSMACMVVAAGGWALAPETWATDVPMRTELTTLLYGHPNPFGWLFQVLVDLHDATGLLLFATCLVPLLSRPGGPTHVRFGRIFVVLWLLHLIDGLINSGRILMARGFEPTRYLDVTNQGFSLYLYLQFAFISGMVIDFLLHGLAAIHHKNRPPTRVLRAVMVAMPLSSALVGAALAVWALLRLARGGPAETPNTYPFAIVFLVQVPPYLYLIAKNVRYWLRPSPRAWLQGWLTEHQRNLMFCVQVTIYTGLANIASATLPAIAPFVFAAIDVTFLVWLLATERTLRGQVVRSRFALALVAALKSDRRPERASLVAPDVQWVARHFDLDRSGHLDRGEIADALAGQGLELAPHELDLLMTKIDLDGDGRVTRAELATFLAHWFGPDPSDEDVLAVAFRALDRDGDGRIRKDELQHAIATGPSSLSSLEADALLAVADLDGDGTLDLEELRAAMRPTRM
jgi:Ca2+-binding EF-hand superfamily protein